MTVNYKVVSGVGFFLEKDEAERIMQELLDDIPDLSEERRELLTDDGLVTYLCMASHSVKDLGDGWTYDIKLTGDMFSGGDSKVAVLAEHKEFAETTIPFYQNKTLLLTDTDIIGEARAKMLQLAARWGLIESAQQDRVGFLSACYVG